MQFQTVFKRYEIKYIITEKQKESLLSLMKEYMIPDEYGISTIRNVYYDTDNYSLVRRSIDKPIYKEKLRIRSYSKASPESNVFVELKKKYDDVVYKRRVSLPEREVCDWFENGNLPSVKSQIVEEIEYFRTFFKNLHPTAYISYDREAFYSPTDYNFRMTFDNNIHARTNNLSLCDDPGGHSLISPSYSVLEIKTAGSIPLWLTAFLSENRIYKGTFSKYGTAYTNQILKQNGEMCYA